MSINRNFKNPNSSEILEQVLLSRVNFFGAEDIPIIENLDLQIYRKTAEAFMCGLLPDSPTATSSRTEGIDDI